MITLKKNEDIEIFQVELSLKLKTKQSPFIAILILAKELLVEEDYYITSEIMQEKLFQSFPLRACENLLERLTNQGYFEEKWYNDTFLGFQLTEQGNESAIDKSFWIGEKGVYNVYTSSNLFENGFSNYHILKIEKSKDLIDDRNKDSSKLGTPQFISAYQYILLALNRDEIKIEDIERWCFKSKSILSSLELKANKLESTITINYNKQTLFQTNIEIEECILQEELLSGCEDFEYNFSKKSILTEFNKENLSFHRKVKIFKPIFQEYLFDQVELENIPHIPSDEQNAEMWYLELLYKNMNDYFLDENSFKEFATELAKPIQLHFKIKVPKRKELAEILNKTKDAFYQIAKLETIDYLNY